MSFNSSGYLICYEASKYAKEKDWASAITVLTEYILENNYLVEEVVYCKITFYERARANYVESLSWLKKGFEHFPESPKLLSEKAMLYFVQKDYYASLDLMIKVVSKNYFNEEQKSRLMRSYDFAKKDCVTWGELFWKDFFKALSIGNMWRFLCDIYESDIEDSGIKEGLYGFYIESFFYLNPNLEEFKERKLTNVAFIPGNNKLWTVLSRILPKYGLRLVLSIDHNPKGIGKELKKQWPCANIYNAFDISKGATLLSSGNEYYPDRSIMDSKDFLEFKLKVFSIMQRQDDEGRFRYLDREAVFMSTFIYFYSQLRSLNVNLLIAGHAPHSPSTFILSETAKLMGIKVFHFIENPLVPMFQLTSSYYGKRYKLSGNYAAPLFLKEKIFEYIDGVSNNVEKHVTPDYMIKQREFDKGSLVDALSLEKKVIPRLSTALNFDLVNEAKGHWQIRNSMFLYTDKINAEGDSVEDIKNKLRENLLSEYVLISEKSPNLEVKYVYYPLHYEPEKTSNPDGGYYWDTYYSVLALRDFLPDDVHIYIKEHYSQFTGALSGYKGKSAYFYKALSAIKNVTFLDFNYSSRNLIENSIAVASKTGTAAFEAAILGRKVILFGYPWFYGCPNVYHIDELISFEELLKLPSKDLNAVKEFVENWIEDYSIVGAMSGSQYSIAKMRLNDIEMSEINYIERTAIDMVSSIKENM